MKRNNPKSYPIRVYDVSGSRIMSDRHHPPLSIRKSIGGFMIFRMWFVEDIC